MRRARGAAAVARVALAGALLLAACGNESGGAPTSKADWLAEHGDVVASVGGQLDRVQASTKEGEPTAIRANCEGLRDANQEARALPAVPDAAAATALTEALDAIAAGAADCTRAMARGDTRLLEKSIAELREARLKLDTANAKLNA